MTGPPTKCDKEVYGKGQAATVTDRGPVWSLMQEIAMRSESLREPKLRRSTLELYLEETEEEVVAILTSYVSPASKSDRSTIDNFAELESGLEVEGAMTDLTNPAWSGTPTNS